MMAYHQQIPNPLGSNPIKCSNGEPDQYEQDVAELALHFFMLICDCFVHLVILDVAEQVEILAGLSAKKPG